MTIPPGRPPWWSFTLGELLLIVTAVALVLGVFREARRERSGANCVLTAVASRDGSRIAATFADGSLRVLDVATGRQLGYRHAQADSYRPSLSADGRWLALLHIERDYLTVYESTVITLTTGEKQTLECWDVDAWQQLWTREAPDAFRSVRATQDAVLAVSQHGKLYVYDVHDGTRAARHSIPTGTQRLALLDDQASYVGISADAVTYYDIATGNKLQRRAKSTPLPPERIALERLSPNGKHLARVVHAYDQDRGEFSIVELCDTERAEVIRSWTLPGNFPALAFVAGGRKLAVLGDDGYWTWDTITRERTPGSGSTTPEFDYELIPVGEKLVAAIVSRRGDHLRRRSLKLHDAETFEPVRTLYDGWYGVHRIWYMSVAAGLCLVLLIAARGWRWRRRCPSCRRVFVPRRRDSLGAVCGACRRVREESTEEALDPKRRPAGPQMPETVET